MHRHSCCIANCSHNASLSLADSFLFFYQTLSLSCPFFLSRTIRLDPSGMKGNPHNHQVLGPKTRICHPAPNLPSSPSSNLSFQELRGPSLLAFPKTELCQQAWTQRAYQAAVRVIPHLMTERLAARPRAPQVPSQGSPQGMDPKGVTRSFCPRT